ncbi:MAG: pilus assembly protein [Alphaproteobacteria bacterium]|nr:pilus assembly protein [Alphaproteobacteria bacterium]
MMVGLIVLGFIAVGAVAFAFLSPTMAGGDIAQKRLDGVMGPKAKGSRIKDLTAENNAQRRKQVQDTLKELERKQQEQKKRITLAARIEQAGLDWDERTFWMVSGICGLAVTAAMMLSGQPLYTAPIAGFAAGLGVPRWALSFLKARREKKFLLEFANAIDIIVRGVKAGLPLNDCLRVIASESPEPVGPEFRSLVEGLKIGVTLEQGLKRMYERTPLPEVNFFAIVLTIQQKTGGNLSEALGNLAGVLRDRKRMKGKVDAMSSEAKASAGIIGSLPIAVMLLVYISTPDYIATLFTERVGNLMLLGSAVWMSAGVYVMRTMINFKI